MYEVYKTDKFARWFKKLRDRQAKSRILARIDLLQQGYFGDVESVGDGVSEDIAKAKALAQQLEV
jgi:putative addiction module killer protein